MGDALDVLLVDDPLLMDEDVTLLKHDLEPPPDFFRHLRRDRGSNVLQEQSVEVIESLEDPSAALFRNFLVPCHSRHELVACKDFEQRHDLLDRIRGRPVEYAVRPSLLTQVVGKSVFQPERAASAFDRLQHFVDSRTGAAHRTERQAP